MPNKMMLDENERWVAEHEPIFMRGDHYYFFQREGWSEAGPFECLEDCVMSFEAYQETSEYV